MNEIRPMPPMAVFLCFVAALWLSRANTTCFIFTMLKFLQKPINVSYLFKGQIVKNEEGLRYEMRFLFEILVFLYEIYSMADLHFTNKSKH